MDKLALVLFLLSIICLIVGIIKPSLFTFMFKGVAPTRKKVFIVFSGATIAFFIISGVVHNASMTPEEKAQQAQANATAKQTKEDEAKKKSEEIAKSQQEKEAKKKAEEAAKTLPKINFTGKIEPTIPHKGQKVVITVSVENLDKEKTIDNIRLLFSNTDFLEEGLIIVNTMSGGQQDGRAFAWKNEGMKMKPGEKRFFTIVAQANKPGKYESVINIKDMKTGKNYEDINGNSELVAKLTVLN